MLTEWYQGRAVIVLALVASSFACSPQPSDQPSSAAGSQPAVATSNVPPNYQGFLEYADCTVILGWAYNAGDPNGTVDVDVYSGSVKLGTARAAGFRQDLLDAGKGNGNHAFRLVIPPEVKDGQPHPLQAKVSGSDFSLVATSAKGLGPCTP